MSGLLTPQTIEEIRSHNDIVDTVGSYLPLKRAGGTFKALCPFHKEKTPSFNVNAQRQIFHCFGCGAGGDVFKFVMDFEGVDFITSARILARRAGLQLEFESGGHRDHSNKDVLYKIHEELAMMYNAALLKTKAGEKARTYLADRDISDEMIKDFLIGYAPSAKNALVKWAEKQNHKLEHMEQAGVLTRYEGKKDLYDRFQGRLMFPIRDELGRVIAFSGRVLDPKQSPAKYVNSPETPLFKKGRILYGLDKARRSIVDARRAILCEGQLDVIRCHHAGLTQAVAPQGTALTADHGKLLKRYAEEVVMVFDADAAGQKAALRSGEVCLDADLSVSVVTLPPGQDPDSLIAQGGAEAFLHVLEEADTLLDFQIDLLAKEENLASESGMLRASKAVLEMIAHVPSDVHRDQLMRRSAERLNLTVDALRTDLNRGMRRKTASTPHPKREEASSTSPASHPIEEVALAELLSNNLEHAEYVVEYLPMTSLHDPDCRRVVEALIQLGETHTSGLMTALVGEGEECLRLAAQVQSAPPRFKGETFRTDEVLKDIILKIRRNELERRRKEIRQLENSAPPEEREGLRVEHSQLTIEIERLRQGWETAEPILKIHNPVPTPVEPAG